MSLPTLTTKLAFSVVSSGYLTLNDSSLGKLDTGQLAADVWTDVSSYVLSVEITQGSQRFSGPTIRYEAGTARITLDNTDGRFDPTNLSGPYVSAGATQVTPMRKVTVYATWNAVDYYLFTGFADSWDVDWYGNTVVLTATDATKVLGNYNGPAQASQGAGEATGARVNRVLDNAGWSTADRLVATGDSTVQATTLASAAWDEILLTADSENGQVFVDGQGRVVFRNRHDGYSNPRAIASQATFGDGTGEYPYESISLTYDDTQLANYVRIARTGGTEQLASDATSQATNLVRTFVRDDLTLTSDSECLSYADMVLYQWKDPELRVDNITVHPSALSDTTVWPLLLGMSFGDRVTVRRRPFTQSGSLVEREVFVRGLKHVIDARDWRTSLTFQSATKWAFFLLDNPTLGVLDTDALSY